MSRAVLPEGYRELKRWDGTCAEPDVIEVRSAEEVLAASALGAAAGDIYFTACPKSVEEIQRVIGKCRIAADSLEELRRIDRAARSVRSGGALEPVGIRLALEDGEGRGIRLQDLPELSRELRGLPAVSVRGCFIQGDASGLHGEALGQYFRSCYEAAKRMSAILPCGVAFLCVTGGGGAARQNAEKHPETLPAFWRAAEIVAAQNQSAFYARLLVT